MDKIQNQKGGVKTTKINVDFKASPSRSSGSGTYRLITTEGADKLAPQAQKIIEALANSKDFTATTEELCGNASGLKSKLDEVGLETSQTPKAIFSHYRKNLITKGFIELI